MSNEWFPEVDGTEGRGGYEYGNADGLYTETVNPGAGIRVIYGITVFGDQEVNVITGEWRNLRNTLKTAFEASGKVAVQKIDGINTLDLNEIESFFIDFRATEGMRISDVIPDYWEIQVELDGELVRVGLQILPAGLEVVGPGEPFGMQPDNIFRRLSEGGITVQSVGSGVKEAVTDSAEFAGNAVGNLVGGVSEGLGPGVRIFLVLAIVGVAGWFILGSDGLDII